MKRPSFQFYPGDWLRDTALRSCSIGARGLWMEMLCLMHEGVPYGHLKVKSKVIDKANLARMSGANINEVTEWIAELEEAGVFSRDEEGCIYSRRMIKDESFRESRAAGGKLGGNPKLTSGYNKPGFVYAMLRSTDNAVKIGISQDPNKRLYKIKLQYPTAEISIIGKIFVGDMGAKEAQLHQLYSHKKDGEWFSLDKEELNHLLDVHLKTNSKGNGKTNQTPSSSSSSSSSSSVLDISDPLNSSSELKKIDPLSLQARTKSFNQKLASGITQTSDANFQRFRTLYPKPGNWEDAQIAWVQKKCDAVAEKIFADVPKRQAEDAHWQEMKFIPNPENYLKREVWKNAIVPKPTNENSGKSTEWAQVGTLTGAR